MRYTEAMALRASCFLRIIACAAFVAAPTVVAAQSDPVTGFFKDVVSGNNPFKDINPFASKSAEKKPPQEPVEAAPPPQDVARDARANTNNAERPPANQPAVKTGKQADRPANAPAQAPTRNAAASPGRDAAAADRDNAVAAALSGAERASPLPPRRPTNLNDATAALGAAAAQQQVRAFAPEQPAAIPSSPQAALARVNAFLNSFERITGTFVQLNPDGQKVGGALLVQRPGQLHFKYDPPSTLEVIADGRSVAVREGRYPQQVYSMSETPLKFLLKERIDLASDMRLVGVKTEPDGLVHVTLEDTGTIGGTSKITLTFDAKANLLKRWDVVDPQGYRTSVALNDLTVTKRAGLN
jgi:outer membrane lipoprotein-sorting protein